MIVAFVEWPRFRFHLSAFDFWINGSAVTTRAHAISADVWGMLPEQVNRSRHKDSINTGSMLMIC
jgi:hypothetical protein